jgi:hypothetical protein
MVAKKSPETRIRLDQMSSRVFYLEFDEDKPQLKEFGEWLNGRFKRDIDFRLEDAGFPMTPPSVRIVFQKADDAAVVVETWKDKVIFRVCVPDGRWTNGDPDHHRHPW